VAGGQVSVELIGRDHNLAVVGETSGGFPYNGEHFRQGLVKYAFQFVQDGFLCLVYFVVAGFPCIQFQLFDALLEGLDVLAFLGHTALDGSLDGRTFIP